MEKERYLILGQGKKSYLVYKPTGLLTYWYFLHVTKVFDYYVLKSIVSIILNGSLIFNTNYQQAFVSLMSLTFYQFIFCKHSQLLLPGHVNTSKPGMCSMYQFIFLTFATTRLFQL